MSRAVMTIHGYLTDPKDFGELYDSLAGYDCIHQCVVPGHGQDADKSLFTVDNALEYVTAEYDRLASQYDSVDVVGYSMGGALTSYLCAVRNVNRAVLLAPSNMYLNIKSIGNWLGYIGKKMRDPLVETSGALTTKIKYTQQHLAEDIEDLEQTMLMAGNLITNITIGNYTVFAKLMRRCNSTINSTYQQSGAINVPTLMIIGKLDELVPRKSVEYLCTRMDNASIVDIPNLGHVMMRSHHEQRLVELIVAHLSSCEQQEVA